MVEWDKNRRYFDNILDVIGRTPMIQFKNVAEGLKPMILGKLEWFSPSGSLKDRIYHEMVTRATEDGSLKPGMEIIETSTGNAGIACSLIGNLKGYKVTIVMPAGMSQERMKMIRSYGAEIITTPGAESDVDLCIEKTSEIKRQNPGKYWEPDQYTNPHNIAAHYKTTGPEIWEQTNGEVDAFVASQGTGGTITGVGRYLREKNPDIRLYAVEPTEAPLLSKRRWGSHKIEGIGDGFVPRNLDLSQLTGVITTTSEESIEMSRRLAVEEGVFCGISSGCNVAACVKLARKHPDLHMIVTMINDTGQRYFSTELCGEEKHVEIPERSHPMDDYTIKQLDLCQSRWEIIE
ncbi:MAG: cysteine synthase family protein [Aigarchaeota archaeon]|nr:cysteine synthase family protein [Aigarchaeota archaeon]